jgi:very-short-patch-repair endonuclease
LAIECDGYSHEILEVYEKDVVKTKKIESLGITVLRFSDHQVMKDLDNAIRAIEDHVLTFEAKNS